MEGTEIKRRGRPPRKILTPVERDGLKERLVEAQKDRTAEIDGTSENVFVAEGSDPMVRSTTQAHEKQIKRTLQEGDPGDISRGERNYLENREKELRSFLTNEVLTPKTHTSMEQIKDPISYRGMVNWMVQKEILNKQNQAAIQEWKQLNRTLHPGDQDASNIERIRPDNR